MAHLMTVSGCFAIIRRCFAPGPMADFRRSILSVSRETHPEMAEFFDLSGLLR